MKIRKGFVSNSSSSSFIIKKEKLTEEQIEKIKNHIVVVREKKKFFDMLLDCDESDAWKIEENSFSVSGQTWMDNFDMHYFLSKIGVEEEDIVWGDGLDGDWI